MTKTQKVKWLSADSLTIRHRSCYNSNALRTSLPQRKMVTPSMFRRMEGFIFPNKVDFFPIICYTVFVLLWYIVPPFRRHFRGWRWKSNPVVLLTAGFFFFSKISPQTRQNLFCRIFLWKEKTPRFIPAGSLRMIPFLISDKALRIP